jgi:hypothetical protein
MPRPQRVARVVNALSQSAPIGRGQQLAATLTDDLGQKRRVHEHSFLLYTVWHCTVYSAFP